ncbi:ribbon-helix-helix protein, CopG family [Parafrankia sp. BMG5.11]|uniref:ribbon-helix-helix protein, CopG family n=1 Tax=Parafrankia sp. BMG5.11 TaxID=222540 RepID=UPI00103CE32B|nr:ribbon-helix-helix protein, CopG family [Parafrankia sp. BMG5.11]TCJ38858.1 ribbon-helix-helix protein, CopG family [Parafrankia sp. BMG5.11]
MTRILADLHDDDIQRLDRMAADQGKSRAAMLREAVQLYLLHRGDDRSWIDRGYGLWSDRPDIRDDFDDRRAGKRSRHDERH